MSTDLFILRDEAIKSHIGKIITDELNKNDH